MLAALLLGSLAMAGDTDLRLGLGLIDLGQLYVGHAPTPGLELHATLGTNLGLLTYFTAGVGAVWRPWRWGGEDEGRQLSLGLGPDLWAGPAPGVVAAIAAGTLDARCAWRRPDAGLGLVLASRWSLGATSDLGDESLRVEPAIMIQPIQVGITF